MAIQHIVLDIVLSLQSMFLHKMFDDDDATAQIKKVNFVDLTSPMTD